MEDTVKLIECQITWQGEGKDHGERMLLTRFKYCNKQCPWCDTLVKMRTTVEGNYNIGDIQELITKQSLALMITGGEPTLNKHKYDTLKMLNHLSYPLANVETNGLNLPDLISKISATKNVRYIWSPKIFTEKDWENEVELLKEIGDVDNVYLKIVYEERELIEDFLKEICNHNINRKVFLMPQGVNRDELIYHAPKVFDACEKYQFNFSSRTHLIFNFV